MLFSLLQGHASAAAKGRRIGIRKPNEPKEIALF
jgi:hypothetical protein